jgi:sugar lactone lactonase YvrE
MKVEHLISMQAELGEAPLWDTTRQCLFMVDIIRCRLIRMDWSSGAVTEWPMPALCGGLAHCRDGRLLVATQTGIFFFNPEAGAYDFFANPDLDAPVNRLNEGKCDPQGRFWIGSICTIDRRASGGLFRVENDGRTERVLSDIVIPNCLVWTLDRSRVYFTDSFRKLIWSFSYEPETGALGDRRLHIDATGNPGIPDGGAIDQDGCLWNAEFGGGCVRRYKPDGRVDREIVLPVTQVTSCAFAGQDLDALVIVTAKRLLSAEERAAQPLSGDVFVVDAGVKGLPEPAFG